MMNGYVTYDELKVLTGWEDKHLIKLIRQGLKIGKIDYEGIAKKDSHPYSKYLFNLNSIEKWLSIHIY